MSDNESEQVVERRVAMIGKVMAIQVPPGTKVFNIANEELLGIVGDRMPVVDHANNAVYLSTDDWLAAEAALPKRDQVIQ